LRLFIKNIFFILIINLLIPNILLAQHLPLEIGNEWHYVQGLGMSQPNIAKVIDTISIDNKLYYKIEKRMLPPNNIIYTYYDRIEGDSLYFRIRNQTESLLFNFNWNDNQIIVNVNNSDSLCTDLLLIQKDTITFWEINTNRFMTTFGFICQNSPDTGWTLSGNQYLKYFGTWDASDGRLNGAIIQGIEYGTLHQISSLNENLIQKDFYISQNYPNPFNAGTVFTFNINKETYYTLSVFNYLGEKVDVIFDEYYMPGEYKRNWNPVNIPSGIYFCRLESNNYSNAIKVIILK
jgi:hypothetical protein